MGELDASCHYDANIRMQLTGKAGRPCNPLPSMIRINIRMTDWAPFLVTNTGVAIAVLLSYLFQRLPHANLSLVFLAPVILVAMRYGMRLAIYAAILSFLIYNFLFTTPLYTLTVAEEGDLATLTFFLFFAVISGHLTARFRNASQATDLALSRLNTLYDFSRAMISAITREDIKNALEHHLSALSDTFIRISLERPEGGNNWLSLEDPRLTTGGIWIEKSGFDPQHLELARNLCEQAAGALVREQLGNELKSAQFINEQERLRSALLSSVSHDLRTPLAGVIGSATSLVEYGNTLSMEDQGELLQSILEAAERLDKYIQNLLDMARIGQGDIHLSKDWIDLSDILDSARHRLKPKLEQLKTNIHIDKGARIIHANGTFLEQAIVNILDNAAQLSPAHGTIHITAKKSKDRVIISVSDEGPGIPEKDREAVFDMFYRIPDADHAYHGTGLGLTICRGLVGAHGGTVSSAPNPAGVGTTFNISLPHKPDRRSL